MKQVALEQLPPEIAELIVSAQCERVVITRNGEPYALVVGVENKDEEDLELEFSPSFWQMIEKRRRSTVSVPMKDVVAALEAEEQCCRDQKAETTPVQCDVPAHE
jgi:antitoxin (DNA-binding transcriptional repressor) of toxin-antitoxin stability system